MSFFITGTDTDVGKTVAASWLMLHLGADYWKPVQAGLEETDVASVKQITGVDDTRFHPCTYELTQPLSPHESARRDGIKIDMSKFQLPKTDKSLIVEGAGGIMVPLNKDNFMIDLMEQLKLPIILVCRSGLGTINHTLLSLQAIRQRGLPLAGLIISGHKSSHNREALEEYGDVPIIAEIDYCDVLNKQTLLSIKPEIDLRTL